MGEIYEQDSRVFEVKIGAEVPSADVDKLAAFATELGLFLVEKPREKIVGVDTFCDIAIQRWGDPAYGMFAEGMLESMRSGAKNMGVEMDDDGSVYVSASAFGIHKGSAIIGDTQSSKHTIYCLAQEVLSEKGRSPFGFALTEGAHARQLFKITPTMATKERLASFLSTKFLDQHTLHGAQGKAFDVLAQAAGLEVDQEWCATREWKGEFIEKKQLWGLLTHERFSRPQIRCLLGGIEEKLMDQQYTGRSQCDYEMVVEVDSRLRQERSATSGWDKVALDSLVSMGSARDYSKQTKGVQKDRMNDTLEDIHEKFHDWMALGG